jgi:glucose/arabinose dehydrogenase
VNKPIPNITQMFVSKKSLFLIFLIFSFFNFSKAQLPPNFQIQYQGNWNTPMGAIFDHSGKMYVWEREGRFYSYNNGIKTEILNISEEVATYGDFGLLSAALDPDFDSNGFIYLYYVVDRHHLLNFGSPSYNPLFSEQGATISRLTRYKLNAANNFNSLMPNSRTILVGETKSTGFPQTGIWHAGGDIKFSLDGTLLVSCGDGAGGADYELQAYQDGITTLEEFNAQRLWRCQLQNSLAGKIIRIDPQTGDGIPSNPFFENLNPRSAQSRVWAMGLRNPFRFTIKPNTGSHNSLDGNPGIIYVGDVGQDSKEEINVVTTGGQNFGWPYLEGFDYIYQINPQYQPTITTKPKIEWGRNGEAARVEINGNIHNVGSSYFPFNSFQGRCALGGVFYEGNSYPIDYHNSYIFADFDLQWVKILNFNENNDPFSISDFSPSMPAVINFSYNPQDENLYATSASGSIMKIVYAPSGNLSPIANFTFNKNFGNSPLNINFDASDSSDPENQTLSYTWNFGDNSTGNGKTISHTFLASSSNPQAFEVTLVVTDTQGASHSITKKISVNNTPPSIIHSNLDSLFKFPTTGNLNMPLTAEVSDFEEPNTALSYKWEVYLYHNNHRHLEYTSNNLVTNYTLGTVPCDNNLYFYRFILIVTDSYGLETIYQKDLFPNCNPEDATPPTTPLLKVDNYNSNTFLLSWSNLSDNDGIKNIEIFLNGQSFKFIEGSNTSYNFQFDNTVTNQNFNAHIIARDFGGNFIKSSVIHFTPSIPCFGNSSGNYLSDIQETSSSNGYGPIEKDKSNGEEGSNDGGSITLNGFVFNKGIGSHAPSEITYNINNMGYQAFSAVIGLDDYVDNIGCGSVVFKVFKDNILAYQSPTMINSSPSIPINIPINNTNTLKLVVESAGDGICGDHGDWADAKFLSFCNSMDLLAPSHPSNLTYNYSSSGVIINWNGSTDNLDENIAYQIYLDETLIETTENLNSSVIPLINGINNFTIQAKDNNGNTSVSLSLKVVKCPQALSLANNQVLNNSFTEFKAQDSIEANNSIIGNSNIIYDAQKYILLGPGFSISQGSVFTTKLIGCGN